MRKNVEKDNLTKILKFFQFLQFLKLDPDQETQINADPCGSGSETLIDSLNTLGVHLLHTVLFVNYPY
jgi:hypothetical protein